MAQMSQSGDGSGPAVAVLVIVLAWPAYYNMPISLYCLGAGVGAWLMVTLAERNDRGDEEASFLERLKQGFYQDTGKVLAWLCFGFAAVWAAQVLLNLLRSRVDPAQVLSGELALYDLADRLRDRAMEQAAFGLAAAILLALLMHSLWPIAALGRLRKALAAAIAFLAAVTTFTFVTAPRAADRYDFAAGPIRAAVVTELQRAAAARQRQAALQWLTARLDGDIRRGPRAVERWRHLYDATANACADAQGLSEATNDDALSAGTRRTLGELCLPAPQPSGEGQAPADIVAGPIAPWLPDFAGGFLVAPNAGQGGGGAPAGLAVDGRVRRLDALRSMQQRAAAAADDAQGARDTLKGIASETIRTAIAGESSGVIGQVADVWADLLIGAFAGETGATIARRVEAVLNRPARPRLLSGRFPLDRFAAAAAQRSARVAAFHAESARLAAASGGPGRSVSPSWNFGTIPVLNPFGARVGGVGWRPTEISPHQGTQIRVRGR